MEQGLLEALLKKEGDREMFEYQEMDCMIARSEELGTWCGYTLVPDRYGNLGYETKVEVHGGISWVGNQDDFGELMYFNKKGYFALGFDCSHLYDLAPKRDRDNVFLDPRTKYRDKEFAISETKCMVDGILEVIKQSDEKTAEINELKAEIDARIKAVIKFNNKNTDND